MGRRERAEAWDAELPALGLGCPSLPFLWLTSPPSPFQEKSLGPSRRTPGTPRPSGANRGGRTHPQQGGRAGVSRASRGWENDAGEQLRGGTGGRGRRGRGRGSPHVLGAGDNSTSDRKSKVGTKQAMKLGPRFLFPVFHSFIFLVLGLVYIR